MSNLNDELSHFAHAIVQGIEPSSLVSTGYANYSLATGIEIYRNNYRGNLHDALAGAYPVAKQLLGDDFFRMVALNFIKQYASRSANLHHYGEELADFLTNFEAAQELVYLSDVASLEWACHTAYFENDAATLDLAQLAQFPPEQHPHLIFSVHPAAHIVRSRYPINAIWQAHQPGASSDFHIDLDSGHCIAMSYRTDDEVQVVELTEAEAEWLQYIQAGEPFGAATISTLEHHPDFDLQTTLLKLVALNVLIDVH
ncbi:MAG: DNA-binding domain-containing protein [Gallionellaceae bacterium]